MIDIHAHILPGLDDGARDMKEALEMCITAAEDGIDVIVATPHTGNGSYNNNRDTILSGIANLNIHLEGNRIPVTVLPGADNYITGDILGSLEIGETVGVNDNKRYVMVEFPASIIPPYCIEWLFRLKINGVTPLLSHPERNMSVQNNTEFVRQWVEKGGLIQVTAMSFLGGFGPEAKKCAESLLQYHLVHVIATDAHSKHRRPPILSSALTRAVLLADPDYVQKLVDDIPAAIIAGEKFDVPAPLMPKKSFLTGLFNKKIKPAISGLARVI